jgi:hypothetical protein
MGAYFICLSNLVLHGFTGKRRALGQKSDARLSFEFFGNMCLAAEPSCSLNMSTIFILLTFFIIETFVHGSVFHGLAPVRFFKLDQFSAEVRSGEGIVCVRIIDDTHLYKFRLIGPSVVAALGERRASLTEATFLLPLSGTYALEISQVVNATLPFSSPTSAWTVSVFYERDISLQGNSKWHDVYGMSYWVVRNETSFSLPPPCYHLTYDCPHALRGAVSYPYLGGLRWRLKPPAGAATATEMAAEGVGKEREGETKPGAGAAAAAAAEAAAAEVEEEGEKGEEEEEEMTPDRFRACVLSKRTVCIMGDSQARKLASALNRYLGLGELTTATATTATTPPLPLGSLSSPEEKEKETTTPLPLSSSSSLDPPNQSVTTGSTSLPLSSSLADHPPHQQEQNQKQYVASKHVKYLLNEYGEPRRARSAAAAQNCSVLVANFGNWPLSFKLSRPWSLDKYGDRLEEFVGNLSSSSPTSPSSSSSLSPSPSPSSYAVQELFFFLTPAYPLKSRSYWQARLKRNQTLLTDWRSEFTIQQYNNVAQARLGGRGDVVRIIDLWSPSLPLSDLSHDGSHYHERGVVTFAFLQTLYQSLCRRTF